VSFSKHLLQSGAVSIRLNSADLRTIFELEALLSRVSAAEFQATV
jgi:type II secretory pathway component PulC